MQKKNNNNFVDFVKNGKYDGDKTTFRLARANGKVRSTSSEDSEIFNSIGQKCRENNECLNIFKAGNKENINCSVLEVETNNYDEYEYYLIVINNNNINNFGGTNNSNDPNNVKCFPFTIKFEEDYHNRLYPTSCTLDTNNIKRTTSNNINSRLNGYGKVSMTGDKSGGTPLQRTGYLESKGISIINKSGVFIRKIKERTIRNQNGQNQLVTPDIIIPDDYSYNVKSYNGKDRLAVNIFQTKLATNEEVENSSKTKLKTNFLCSYSDQKKFISIEEEASQFITERNNKYGKNHADNKIEFEIISNAAALHLGEKIYPVDSVQGSPGVPTSYKFKTFLNEGGHFVEQNCAEELCNTVNTLNSVNRGSYIQCSTRRISSREEGSGNCKMCNQLKIRTMIDIDTPMIDILKMFKYMNLNSKILPFTSNINDISDIKLLYKDAKSIDEVFDKVVETYNNNKDFFSKEQSESFINNFNSVINDYILIFTNSDYEKKYNCNEKIDGFKLNNMLNSYFDALEIHENKYNEHLDDITLYPFDEFDSQS